MSNMTKNNQTDYLYRNRYDEIDWLPSMEYCHMYLSASSVSMQKNKQTTVVVHLVHKIGIQKDVFHYLLIIYAAMLLKLIFFP